MTTEALARASSHSGSHPVVTSVFSREAGQWLLARVTDGHEATFSVEVDERFWRIRRTHGATASMFEAHLPGPLSTGDVTAALARWATGAGFSVRSTLDDGAHRVTLTRPAD